MRSEMAHAHKGRARLWQQTTAQVARDGPPLTSLRCFFAVFDGPHPILLLRRSAASPSNFFVDGSE